jgi:hypothetical protein
VGRPAVHGEVVEELGIVDERAWVRDPGELADQVQEGCPVDPGVLADLELDEVEPEGLNRPDQVLQLAVRRTVGTGPVQ